MPFERPQVIGKSNKALKYDTRSIIYLKCKP